MKKMRLTKWALTLALFVLGLGGVTSIKAENSYLEITTNSVKANAWEWAIWYQLSTPLVEGETYVLTMDAKCSENFDMAFWPVNTAEGGKTTYTGYKIGTEWAVCKCEFTANDALNRLSWDFGSLNGKLYFDNVKLVKKGETTNLIEGGDFESGLNANWGNDGWNKPEYEIYTTSSTPKKYLKMTTNAVKSNAWEWAIWYKLDTPLENGKTYVLTMKAKCSEGYDMSFWPYKDKGQTKYTGYHIGTEWGDCSCTFEANDDLEYLKWCFGSLNGTVCFDDVSLVEQGATTNLINGGDFESGLAANWGDDGWNKPEYGVVIMYPPVEAVAPTPEVLLDKSMFKSWDSPDAGAHITSNSPYWDAVDYGTDLAEGAVLFGSGNVTYTDYADLSAYSGMKIYGSGNSIRVMFNRAGADPVSPTVVPITPTAEGAYLDFTPYLTDPGYLHLNAIKVNWGGTATVTNITLIDPTATSGTDYVLSGDYKDGGMTTSVTSALEDANAKVIDLTGVEGKNMTLASANPNCLFVAKAGQLTNTQNVIIGTTCDNLVLTDKKPFKAPFDFTATQASYTTTISSVGAGTLCLPFACKIPYEVQAWTLAYTSGGDKATATEVETVIPANIPVLLNGSGEKTFTGADAAITAGAATTAEALTGVYEQGFVPKDCYVLQNGASGLGFYKVANDNEITIKPFRAYLTASASSAPSVSIVYGSDDTTGINTVEAADSKTNEYFNIAGQRVAQPTKGLYIVNGKKVLVK